MYLGLILVSGTELSGTRPGTAIFDPNRGFAFSTDSTLIYTLDYIIRSRADARPTRAAGPATNATTVAPPAPARSRWLKGHHGRNEQRHVGELKSTLHDPNTSTAERDQAKAELNAMGRGREAHVPMSVRVKSMFRSNKNGSSREHPACPKFCYRLPLLGPMARRKKNRTHLKGGVVADGSASVDKSGSPKSFVVKHGQVGPALSQLVRDLRKVMEPNTASRLRERKRNKLKDYLVIAPTLGVTHIIALTLTPIAPSLRIVKLSAGPTLSFRIESYSLAKDLLGASRHARSIGMEYLSPPLLVLASFPPPGPGTPPHLSLIQKFFQALFPPLSPHTVSLSSARRVILISYNSESGTISIRHYLIGVRALGVSRHIRKLVDGKAAASHKVLDLGKENDLADYVLRAPGETGPDGYESASSAASDVDGEGGAAEVHLAGDYVGRNNRAGSKRAVKLTEIGPRLELRLVKITEGVPGKQGAVLYHEFVKKTAAETSALKKAAAARAKLKKERKEEQARNVERKKAEKERQSSKGKGRQGDGQGSGDEEVMDEYSDGSEHMDEEEQEEEEAESLDEMPSEDEWDEDEDVSEGSDEDEGVDSSEDEAAPEPPRPTKRFRGKATPQPQDPFSKFATRSPVALVIRVPLGSFCDIQTIAVSVGTITTHLWTISLATVTYLSLAHPLGSIIPRIESVWFGIGLWIYALAIGLSVGIWKLSGATYIGGYCDFGGEAWKYNELVNLIPRLFVLITIASVYAQLHVLLRCRQRGVKDVLQAKPEEYWRDLDQPLAHEGTGIQSVKHSYQGSTLDQNALEMWESGPTVCETRAVDGSSSLITESVADFISRKARTLILLFPLSLGTQCGTALCSTLDILLARCPGCINVWVGRCKAKANRPKIRRTHGYHIAALNQISDVLTCKVSSDPKATSEGWLSLCVPMDDAQFGVVTAAFTIGGFAGSLCADRFLNKGRKHAVSWHASLLVVGTTLMSLANSIAVLVLGRLVIGFACGIGICTVPIYLAEVSPPAIQGRIGVLNQLGIVFGIFGTSVLGLYLATPSTWRWVIFASAIVSAAQLVWSLFVVESPSWLRAQGRTEEATHVAARLWDVTKVADQDEGEALLRSEVEAHVPDQAGEESDRPAINVPTLLASSDLHGPMAIVLVAMLVQQASGINAVIYYSNNILSRVVPREAAAYTSLGITVLNAIMTFPAIFLVDVRRLGRKRLFMASMMGAIVSSAALGIALDNGITALSSVAVLGFIASFAIGLGPVPYLMISELTPYYVRLWSLLWPIPLTFICQGCICHVFACHGCELKTVFWPGSPPLCASSPYETSGWPYTIVCPELPSHSSARNELRYWGVYLRVGYHANLGTERLTALVSSAALTPKPTIWHHLIMLIKSSRPPGWTFGPILYGIGAIHSQMIPKTVSGLAICLSQIATLSFPLCIVVFGVNDVYDYETDIRNPRKSATSLEGTILPPSHHDFVYRSAITASIITIAASVLPYTFGPTSLPSNGTIQTYAPVLTTTILVALGWMYSAPPARFKEIPIIDSISNGLIVFLSWFLGYVSCRVLAGDRGIGWKMADVPSKGYVLGLVTASVHALGAAADIDADLAAGQRTIGTVLGSRGCATLGVVWPGTSHRATRINFRRVPHWRVGSNAICMRSSNALVGSSGLQGNCILDRRDVSPLVWSKAG
ncbi:rRNA binding protein [Rhizoctonia solani AG-1 IA]|uniref:rRNA binding protein n=1 Tax=Thanatephorus cucumeris (strain AG1-IA) TaxID=983506 RepID=L8WTI2_THACA|nr:rRNA binding protein [Rhizoctonia solani AG-1 IA]